MTLRLFVKWFFVYSLNGSLFVLNDMTVLTLQSRQRCHFVGNTASSKQIITKGLKYYNLYIFSDTIFTCSQFSRRCISPHFWILPAFIWGQCSLVLVTFSWFFHKFNKRYMFSCYKSSCSGNLLTQSCLLIPVSYLVVKYSEHV